MTAPGRRPPSRAVVSVSRALVGGALTACAFEPVAVPYLAPLGVALLVLSVRTPRRRDALLAGTAFGAVFMGGVLWWLWASVAPGAWLLLTAVQALWFGALGLGLRHVSRLRLWPAWSAALWTAVEVLRSTWPLGGMPWGRLGFSSIHAVWSDAVAWFGVVGTGFLVALMGCGLAAVLAAARPSPRLLAGAALPWVVALVPAAVVAAGPTATAAGATTARVGVVQGGVPGDGRQVAAHHREVMGNHADETRRLAARTGPAGRPDFVLWPESSTAADPERDPVARAAVDSALDAAGTPLLAGSVVDGAHPDQARNEGVVWTSAGPADRYTKQHLVPFGEYVPLRAVAERLSSRVAAIRRDMLPGRDQGPIRVAGTSVADALCFDVAYDDVIGPQVRRGARLVTVQTSNAMFLGTSQPEQQWDITRVRAIETGRSVVVASINGISGAIGPDGSVVARLPSRVTDSVVVEVALADGVTPAVRIGAWPARLVLGSALLGLALATVHRRRVAPPSVGRQVAEVGVVRR